MADLEYIYAPYYGVEPFDPATVGATLTGHNLVVTVWTTTGNDVVVTPGTLVQPASQNSALLPLRQVADGQAMGSRCSAQMFFAPDEADKNPLTDTMLFVLNPPPELRQQWANALVFNGGDPLDPASFTALKSLMCGYTWVVQYDESPDEGQNLIQSANALCSYYFGTLTDLGTYTGVPGTPVPLLKTSGADGQAPEYFDTQTAQGVAEMIAAVNAGSFFVPLVVVGDFNGVPVRVTLTYPHSVAR